MKTTGEIVKKYRELKNISMEEMGNSLDVSASFINALEKNRKKPSEKFLERFYKEFFISEEDKNIIENYENIRKTPEPILEQLKELEKEVKKLKTKDQSNMSISQLETGEAVDMIQVPVYDSVSAGSGLEPNPEPVDVLLLPKSVAEGCVIINVWGDSMEPSIKNGYAVMVKKEVEVANNDIGIFIHEGEALVKRYKCFDGHCFLYSDNTNYPPREVRKNDDFKVCGKVIWIMEKA
ncbi:S24 family peptidase [uncultured Ilyobacter sp.]|uniref:S24 family peptidase n=1 Tax=uncultured Ilyobacter sp. TaxID=544433 RepID=UPI0029C6BCB8|nr:S24 family peptidase [uncultured Ilyobacter sp.]